MRGIYPSLGSDQPVAVISRTVVPYYFPIVKIPLGSVTFRRVVVSSRLNT